LGGEKSRTPEHTANRTMDVQNAWLEVEWIQSQQGNAHEGEIEIPSSHPIKGENIYSLDGRTDRTEKITDKEFLEIELGNLIIMSFLCYFCAEEISE
jgi:hypothetical protein